MGEISIKKAAFINAASRYSTIVLNLVFSAVLARLLTPEDYGIVAVTAVFTTFFTLFADMGIGAGVIQNKELAQDDISSIYTFTVRISFVLALAFMAFSVPMAWFYKDRVYVPVGMLLAVSLFFSAMNMVPNALLLKEKRFVAVGIRTVVACILSGGVGILFALLGFKYYALVLQNIFNAVFIFIWNYVSTRPRVVRKICKESVGKIRSYSSFLFAFNIINYFSRNSDNLLISKFMGTASLGYYDKAYKLMCYPTQNLTHVITPVLHPILSEHQNDRNYIYEKYLRIMKLLSLCGIFIMTFCFFASDEIIRIIFGERWIPAIPCFKYMSISIWAQMITSSSGSIFQSLGDSRRMFISGTLNAALTVAAIVLGVAEGRIEAVARNVGIVYNFHFISTYIILVHFSFGMSCWKFLMSFLPDFGVLLFCVIAGIAVDYCLYKFGAQGVLLSFSIKFCFIFMAYIISLFVFRQWKTLTGLIRT